MRKFDACADVPARIRAADSVGQEGVSRSDSPTGRRIGRLRSIGGLKESIYVVKIVKNW